MQNKKNGTAMKIHSTTNYKLFVFKKGNRPVKPRVVALARAMKINNQLDRYPILVSELPNGLLEIADGQHRFQAAKRIGVPIFYIKVPAKSAISIEDIAEANRHQKPWSLGDWLHSWCERNAAEYLKLQAYCRRWQIPVSQALEIISIGTDYSATCETDAFKRGQFIFQKSDFADAVGKALAELRQSIRVGALRFDRAFIRVMRVPGVNWERLVRKLISHRDQLAPQFSWPDWVRVMDRLYNYKVRAHEYFPLAAEVERLERERISRRRKSRTATMSKAA